MTFDIDTCECSQIELKAFEVLHNQERICSFGRWTIFNNDYVSVLIKNMTFMVSFSHCVLDDIADEILLAINNRFISIGIELIIWRSADALIDAIEMMSTGVAMGLVNAKL